MQKHWKMFPERGPVNFYHNVKLKMNDIFVIV